jgi:hypothetical protein
MHPLNKAYKRPAVASIGNTTATRKTHEQADDYLDTRICTYYNNIYLEKCRLRSILKCLAEKWSNYYNFFRNGVNTIEGHLGYVLPDNRILNISLVD